MFALVRQQYEHLFRKYEKRYFVKGDIRSNFGFQKFEADQLVIDFGLRKTDNSFLRFRQSVQKVMKNVFLSINLTSIMVH